MSEGDSDLQLNSAFVVSSPGKAELTNRLAATQKVLLTGSATGAAKPQAAVRGHRRSTDAGQYVCQSTFWTLLDYTATHSPAMHAGFLHLLAISEVWPAQRVVEVVWELVQRTQPSREGR